MKNLPIREIMNRELLLARENMTVGELATFLTENEISGAPVVNDQGRLTGVVSLADVGRATSRIGNIATDRPGPDFYLRDWEETYNVEDLQRLHVEGGGVAVRDIMTRTIHSVPESATLQDVAQAMVKAHVHRLLVTGSDENVPVGIVSTMDLLAVLVKD